ncbi:MAG: hypothetical protein ACKPKO_53680, partial [Candidatus Fonsibacter sp.]
IDSAIVWSWPSAKTPSGVRTNESVLHLGDGSAGHQECTTSKPQKRLVAFNQCVASIIKVFVADGTADELIIASRTQQTHALLGNTLPTLRHRCSG